MADKPPKITEEEFSKNVIRVAQLCHWKVAHFRSVKIQRQDGSVYYATPVQADGAGFPDLLMMRDSRLVIAELKSETGKTSADQDAWIKGLRICDEPTVKLWKPSNWDDIVLELE